MYINDRDQINYHGFLKASRELQGASLKQVAEGICTESEISRVEIGDRLPEKLMRDRITSRLGISGEEYEEYLRPEEYRQWEVRMYILDQLNKGDAKAVEKGIAVFEQIPDRNPVQEQFVDTMRFMLAQMNGVSKETLAMMIELAVVHTIPSIGAAFEGAQLLADQELNLIAEYTHLCEYYGEEEETKWRLGEYKKILNYVDNSIMDSIGKSKIYPKVTCFICELLLEGECTDEELYFALDMCNKSVECLRDASRLYYFVELMEYRQKILKRVLTIPDLSVEEIIKLRGVYDKDAEWEQVLKDLYKEYGVPVYMQNFTYLYVETEGNSAVEVIRTRRNMYKLSRVRVSDNICTDKTVERFENYEHSPSIVIIRDIFERIGLCAEYKRARVITDDAKMLGVTSQLTNYLNKRDTEGCRRCLEIMKQNLHMDINFNQQMVKRHENILEIREAKQDKEYLYKSALEALEYTIPFSAVIRKEKVYLTREELLCLYDLAYKVDGEISNTCKNIIEKMCNDVLEINIDVARLCIFEILMGELASDLGNRKDYISSARISNKMLKECLYHRRLVVLVDNMYNNLWNYEQEAQENNQPLDKTIINDYLEKCLALAELAQKDAWVTFLQRKISTIRND